MRTGIVSNSIICLPLLNYLHSAGEDVIVFSAELTVNDKGAIASFCTGAGVSCTHEKSSGQSLYDWVNKQQPDIIFVVGYNEIIRLSRFTTVMPDLFNVHFGHLPEYRGPNPVFWQLKKGAPSLAITIHCVNDRLDAGAVAWKKEYPNEPFFNYGYVHQLMSHYVLEGVHTLLQLKKQGHPISLTVQDERRAAYYGRPDSKDICICWKTMNAPAICDLVKACNPWKNGATAFYNGFEVRINDAEPVKPEEAMKKKSGNGIYLPGTIIDTSPVLLVSCSNNEAIRIHSLVFNGMFMPGRFAANYGFVTGQSFNNI